MSRRSFLGTVAAGAAAASATMREGLSAQTGQIRSVGVQLYTVRTEMEKNVDATLARLAAIGYKEVEFAGYFNLEPAKVKALLSAHGLSAPSTHVGYATIADSWPAVIEASHTIGHKYIVIPWLDDDTRKQPDIWKKVAASLNKAGEATKKAGMQLAYHNHNFEFVPENGTLPYDFLLKECDKNLVKMEMDLCWTIAAGQDPVAYFKKQPGRFTMVHVKDLKKKPAGATTPIADVLPDITEVGAGIIDWKGIFAHAKEAGIEHYFVEHDQPAAPFDSVAASYKYVSALRF